MPSFNHNLGTVLDKILPNHGYGLLRGTSLAARAKNLGLDLGAPCSFWIEDDEFAHDSEEVGEINPLELLWDLQQMEREGTKLPRATSAEIRHLAVIIFGLGDEIHIMRDGSILAVISGTSVEPLPGILVETPAGDGFYLETRPLVGIPA